MLVTQSESIIANQIIQLQIRAAGDRDVNKLVQYFGTLSRSSRYNRFMEPDSNFSRFAFESLVQNRSLDHFMLIAELQREGRGAVIGEATFAPHGRSGRGKFAVSVSHAWHGRGVGSALLSALEARAISSGYFELFGETLKTNEPMKGLARKAGFALSPSADWRTTRLDKRLIELPHVATALYAIDLVGS
jgi:GNAT superfamily N-acetyltransferase